MKLRVVVFIIILEPFIVAYYFNKSGVRVFNVSVFLIEGAVCSAVCENNFIENRNVPVPETCAISCDV